MYTRHSFSLCSHFSHWVFATRSLMKLWLTYCLSFLSFLLQYLHLGSGSVGILSLYAQYCFNLILSVTSSMKPPTISFLLSSKLLSPCCSNLTLVSVRENFLPPCRKWKIFTHTIMASGQTNSMLKGSDHVVRNACEFERPSCAQANCLTIVYLSPLLYKLPPFPQPVILYYQ